MTTLTKKANNLVWIDLEMSGLNVYNDVILEIATIITDGSLNILAVGPHFILNQPQAILDQMDSWCTETHAKSGLTKAVQHSTTTITYAEKKTLQFIKQYCPPQTGLLAGNSVWQDRLFLQKYMPKITEYLFYRLIDVTSIKELISQWYPESDYKEFTKAESHRALEDIHESIEELRFYKNHFFI